jgi:hypothetical protein
MSPCARLDAPAKILDPTMQPYRPLYVADDEARDSAAPEDRALAVLLIVLGAVRVVPAIATGETFGAEATVAAIMVVLGVVMSIRLPASVRRRLRR